MPFLLFLDALVTGLDMHFRRKARLHASLLLALLLLSFGALFVPGELREERVSLRIEEGVPFRVTAEALEKAGVAPSSLLLRVLARLSSLDGDIRAGEYRFEEPLGTLPLLLRLSRGDTGVPVRKVTFPEGHTVREMAAVLEASLPGFDAASFEREAVAYEGYLFPDTYLIPEDASVSAVLALLRETFEKKRELLKEEIAASPYAFEDAVVMASLLEKEGRIMEERRIIAGILWDRIEIGMPLQVDAVFGYIKGVDTYHPSGEDLELDSPYNTYENRGLPPGPIGNPGLEAIRAALRPIETPYLYYLTGTDGVTRYAETFEEHKANKEAYLR